MIHKKITSSLFAFTIAACSIQAAPSVAIAKDAKLEQQVEATLSKMTLEEKIGQMTELAIDVLGCFVDGEFQLDEAKLRKAIAEYKVGSFLNAPGPVAQDKDKWQEIIGTIQSMSMKEIGIPCIYGLDQNSLKHLQDMVHSLNSMYLWVGPKPWNDLYIGWHPLPSEHQPGCFVQSRPGIRSRTCNCIRNTCQQLPVDLLSYCRHVTRSTLAARMGKLW